jgi:hypothetical protein
MIVTEQMENKRILHYSDSGFRILQNETGVVYDDAVDVLPCRYTYSETEEQIPVGEDATEADYQAALARLGVQ